MEENEGLFYRKCDISLYVPVYTMHTCSYRVSPSPPFRWTPLSLLMLIAMASHLSILLFVMILICAFHLRLISCVGGTSAFHLPVSVFLLHE